MSEFRAVDYVGHIVDAAVEAMGFIEGMSKEDFLADARTQKAVEMNLVVIGEAATKVLILHPNFAVEHSNVPWRVIKGMRNQIAHGYFSVDLDVVWDTVQAGLPELIKEISIFRENYQK